MIQVKSRIRVTLDKVSHSPKTFLAFVSIALLSGVVLLLAFWVSAESVTEVTTLPADEITETTARLHGTALSSPTATRGFQIGLTNSYGSYIADDDILYETSDLTFGGLGTGNGQFTDPSDTSVDSNGNVYVLEAGSNARVQKFSSAGTYITQWGSEGTGNGQFTIPTFIFIDRNDNDSVYVQDDVRLQKFTSAGVYISTIIGPSQFGNGDGEFVGIAGVATDSLGNIYVVDQQNQRVQKLDQNGTYITKWGNNGSGNGQFSGSMDIVIDSNDNVYVADRNNLRIQKFTSDGTYLSQWNAQNQSIPSVIPQSTFGPIQMDIDIDNNLYVTLGDVFRVYTSEGVWLSEWRLPGIPGDPSSQVTLGGISVAPDNRIYTLDMRYNRVISFVNTVDEVAPDLTCGTTYHFRAYATAGGNTMYGEDQTFTTDACDLEITTETLPAGTVGTAYDQNVETANAIGTLNIYIRSGTGNLPPGLSISNFDTTTGRISGTPNQVGTYTFQVGALDSEDDIGGERRVHKEFTITINPPAVEGDPLEITTLSLPDGTVGSTYNQNIETINALGSVAFSLDSGTLPTGLVLGNSNSTTGHLNSNPTQVGTYTFTVKATDSEEDINGVRADTQQYTITINAPPDEDEPLQITTTALPDGTVGSPYSFSIEAINGNGPLTWSITAGALDTGLGLGASDGLISGTPVLAGTYSLTVSVTDGDDTDSAQFTHLVNPLTSSPPPGTPTPPKTGSGLFALIVALSCASAGGILALFNAIKKWEIKEHSEK